MLAVAAAATSRAAEPRPDGFLPTPTSDGTDGTYQAAEPIQLKQADRIVFLSPMAAFVAMAERNPVTFGSAAFMEEARRNEIRFLFYLEIICIEYSLRTECGLKDDIAHRSARVLFGDVWLQRRVEQFIVTAGVGLVVVQVGVLGIWRTT